MREPILSHHIMGKLRDQFKLKSSLAKGYQATEVTCIYCKGNGRIILQEDAWIHRERICPFCCGSGGVTKEMFMACSRWISIVRHHKRKGLCPVDFMPNL